MNINEIYQSEFITAMDLKGSEWILTMSHVENREMNDGKVKPVVFFLKASKGLVLNKTNAMTIASYFGPETDGWRNMKIILYPVKVLFNKQMTDAIRIRALPQRAAVKQYSPQQPVSPAEAVGFDESEIPAPPQATKRTSFTDDEIPF